MWIAVMFRPRFPAAEKFSNTRLPVRGRHRGTAANALSLLPRGAQPRL